MFSCSSDPVAQKKQLNIAYEFYPNGKIKTETEVHDTTANGLMKKYDRDGNLMSVYTFKMGKLDGPAVSYYPNGNIEQKMNYRDGKKEGITQWFYSSGELYRKIPYKEGKIDGIKFSYYKDGKVMAEAPYKDGFPGTGLKEYNSKGELNTKKFKILVEEKNTLFIDNHLTLKITLTPVQKDAVFYLGDLAEGKYLNSELWQIPGKDGTAELTVTIPKGGFQMETYIITANIPTSKSNYQVISVKYNLAADNK